MENIEILKQLCVYDIRNPDNCLDCVDEEDVIEQQICYCDNCFYGRTTMANYILELLNQKHENTK